jgi:ferredoxin
MRPRPHRAALYLKRFNVREANVQAALEKHAVLVVETGEEYLCGSAETLLEGMARIGRKCIPVGCVNGGCGVCKVAIVKGQVHKCGPMSRVHVSEEEELRGILLACRAMPISAIELEVIGKMKKLIW